MTAFDDRLKGQLAQFKHEMELMFRTRLRRNKLFGLEIAKKLGLEDESAVIYAKSVVLADLQKRGDEEIINKVMADMRASGLDVDEVDLERELKKLSNSAKEQVMKE